MPQVYNPNRTLLASEFIGPKPKPAANPNRTPNSDNLWIGFGADQGSLLQFSISQQKVVNTFPNITPNLMTSISIHPSKKFLYLGDSSGTLTQFSTLSLSYLKSLPTPHNTPILSLRTSPNGRHLFSASPSSPLLVHYNAINPIKITKIYTTILKGISSLTTTHDDQYLFAGSTSGSIIQVSIIGQSIIRNILDIHESGINGLILTSDDRLLITCMALIPR